MCRVSFRIFVKGREGKRDNCQVKGGKEYSSNFVHDFSLEKDIIVLTRGVWGMLPQENF